MTRRILPIILWFSLSLTLLLTACDSTAPAETATAETDDTPVLLTHIYRESPLAFPTDWQYGGIAGTDGAGGTVLYLTKTEYTQNEAGETVYHTAIREMTLWAGGEQVLSERVVTAPDSGYNRYILAGESRVGLVSAFDLETRSNSLHLEIIAPDDKVTVVEDVGALFPENAFQNPEWPEINGMAADGEGYLYLSAPGGLLMLHPDGSIYGVMDMACQDLLTKEGRVYLRCFDETRGIAVLREIDRENRSLAPPLDVFPPQGERVQSYHLGPDYLLYFTTAVGLYGQNEGVDPVLLLHFANSNLPESLSDCAVLDATHLFASFSLGMERIHTLLVEGPDVDLSAVTTVTLALVAESDGSMMGNIGAMAINYNRTHPETRIQVLDYTDTQDSQGNTQMGSGVDRLLREMEAGTVRPDLFYGKADPLATYLVTRGLAADFTPFLTADDTYTLDDLFGAVKNTYSHDGILYGLPQTFTLDSVLLADREIFGSVVGNWTLDTLFSMMDTLGEDVWLDTALESDVWLDHFIDWEEGTCSFDNPLFARILDRAMTKTPYMPKVGIAARRDGETENIYRLHQDGTVPLASVTYRMASDMVDEGMYFGVDNGIRLGYPSVDGKGVVELNTVGTTIFLMHEDCGDKEAAWGFVRYVMETVEDTFEMTGMRRFPAWKHVYQAVVSQEEGMQYFVDYMGGRQGTSREIELAPDGTYQGEVGVKVVLTGKMLDDFADWLDGIGRALPMQVGMDEVMGMLEEEVAIFAAGDCDAETCAKRIQSRVGLWLAERH